MLGATSLLVNILPVGDAVTRITNLLGSKALEEIGLASGAADEVEKLKATLSTIRAVLLDAEKQSSFNHQDKDWLGKLEDAVFYVEDMLDEFTTDTHLQPEDDDEGGIRKKVRRLISGSSSVIRDNRMGHRVKEIRVRLDGIAADRQNFHWVPTFTSPVIRPTRPPTHSFVFKEDVIGREDDKLAIIKHLLDPNLSADNVAILPIVGMGGLGKTTLAQLVYNDPRVVGHFDLKMWVCVSDVFDVKDVVEKIVKSGTGGGLGNLEFDDLQHKLREKIHGKRYLLVLDDVWNENLDKWLKLRQLLIRNGVRGSRIIVTTRNGKVAMLVTNKQLQYWHKLEGLSKSASWALFIRVVFDWQEPMGLPNVIEVGKEIVRRCRGVPLAIRTIASLLLYKNPQTEWPSFLKNDFTKLRQDDGDILPILRLSYDNLPLHLKHCFAFCSIFPKDYEINVERLIEYWIGEGLVRSLCPDECLQEIGMEYFKDLLWGSFFQDVIEDKWGNITTCKMHDLMHDLAIIVGGEENVTISSNSRKGDIIEKARRMSFVEQSVCPFDSDFLRARRLRALFLLSRINKNLNLSILVNHSKRLLVLTLGGTYIDTIPDCIGELKHLKCLDLSWTKIRRLPNTITKLQNLVVLSFFMCHCLEELPTDINKFVNLKHLDISGCYPLRYMPRALGELTSLEKLTTFLVDKDESGRMDMGGMNQLANLNNLRGSMRVKFHTCIRISEIKLADMKQKQHLSELHLFWFYNKIVNDEYEERMFQNLDLPPNLRVFHVRSYRYVRFFNCSSLMHLVHMEIFQCDGCKYLSPLNQLPQLKYLDISHCKELEYIESDGSNINWMGSQGGPHRFFPSLKELHLYWCRNLKGLWRRERGDHLTQLPLFPCLSLLRIEYCSKLCWIPLCPTLHHLILRGISKKMIQQLLKQGMTSVSSPSSSFYISPLSQLKTMEIGDLEIKSLPTEVWQNLSSLQTLDISRWGSLNCLPLEMHSVKSLRELTINDCDKLKQRCKNKKAVDWPIISHIPNILIDHLKIQEDGRYLRSLDDDASSSATTPEHA